MAAWSRGSLLQSWEDLASDGQSGTPPGGRVVEAHAPELGAAWASRALKGCSQEPLHRLDDRRTPGWGQGRRPMRDTHPGHVLALLCGVMKGDARGGVAGRSRHKVGGNHEGRVLRVLNLWSREGNRPLFPWCISEKLCKGGLEVRKDLRPCLMGTWTDYPARTKDKENPAEAVAGFK